MRDLPKVVPHAGRPQVPHVRTQRVLAAQVTKIMRCNVSTLIKSNRVFRCHICDRGFSKVTNLRNHLFLHTGESNFERHKIHYAILSL